MALSDAVVPVPPDGVRPGLLSAVVRGRVIMGDLAVSLVDLSVRKLIRIEQATGDSGSDWLLSPLLAGLASHGAPTSLSAFRPHAEPPLRKVGDGIVHDAVRRGWIGHVHHDRRTTAGGELAHRISTFEAALRQFIAGHGPGALPAGLTGLGWYPPV